MDSENESGSRKKKREGKRGVSRWIGIALLAVNLVAVLGLHLAGDTKVTGQFGMAVGAAAAVLLVAVLFDRFPMVLSVLLLAVTPVGLLCLTECFTHVPQDLTVPIFLFNLLFYYLVCLLLTFVTGQLSLGFQIASILFLAAGLANSYVVRFRGSPIMPWDIFSVKTAASVADNYSFEISFKVAMVLIGFLALIMLAGRTKKLHMNRIMRAGGTIVFAGLTAGWLLFAQTENCVDLVGLDTTLFTPNVLYRNNGLMGGFLPIVRFVFVQKPDGYSVKAVEELIGEETETAEETAAGPNVIVIMNEAFSDLSAIGEFETSEDYMPFIHSIQDKYTSGNLYVSVKGGNTANTEYEFLTGDTMAFLPVGSVAYQQYIKNEMPSVASYLAGLGYETTAIHPYNRSGWNREEVYEDFGFYTFLDKSDFENPTIMRKYVSDQSAFERIEQLYEEKEEGQPMFVFEVTMQNHGGYTKEFAGFEPEIFMEGLSENVQTRAVNKYLTLVRESDRAFEKLCEYFSEVEEDTIILMFGDHEPSYYITNPVFRLCGLDPDDETLEVHEKGYVVPFIMWSNFDTEAERFEEGISANYLSGLLMEKAGLPLTGYMRYQQELMETLPVITQNMVMDSEGTMYTLKEAQKLFPELNEYNILTYNHLVDTDHTDWEFFN